MLWDLAKMYRSFDDPELERDILKAEGMIKELSGMLDNIGDADIETAMPGYFEKTNRLGDLFGNIYAFAQLSYSVDTENTKALDVIERMEAMIPDLSVVGTRFAKWAASVADQIPEGVSDEYGFHISDAVRKSEYMLGDEMERVIALMKNTGSGAWSRLQDVLTSSLTMELDGVETPLFQLRNMAYDPSPEIRKKAYEAELGAYPQIEKSSAASLNAIKGEVIALSKLRGYGSPLEMTLMNSRMDRETLDSMLEAIYEYLPVFRKYLRKKAQMLGHGAGLPFYDLFAPLGGAGGKYGFEDARRFIVESFATFSGELSEFADRAFEGKWIDAKIRKGKVGGAFCYNIHGIKESRIMSNFSGAFSDVTTLAHELGHGYHGECLKDAPQVNSDYPMPLAETASIFCESIAMDHAMEIADGKEKIAILEHGLMEATQVVVDILGRYIFETGLFEKRSTSSVPVDELKNMMVDAQKQSYGDGLDENLLHPYMWACKPHYYMPETNFYNFPYTFGLLFAKGLYAMYLEEGGGLSPNTKNSFLKPEGTT